MAQIEYFIYDPDTFLYMYGQYLEEGTQPLNSTTVPLTKLYFKPTFNTISLLWYEGGTPEEVEGWMNTLIRAERDYAYSLLLATDPYIDAFRDRGEVIPEDVKAERENILNGMRNQILYINPNYDFESLKTKVRMLLGFEFIATSAGKPTIPELKGVEKIFSVTLGKTPINVPNHNIETGFLDLNLAIGNTLYIIFKASED